MAGYNIVGIIVHAKDGKEAFAIAKKALDAMMKLEMFEYYSTFDEKDTLKEDHWGCDWGHLPAVVLATSPEGKHFIEVKFQHTIEKFKALFEDIKLSMPYLTPEILMDETVPLPEFPRDIAGRLLGLTVMNRYNLMSRGLAGRDWFLCHEYYPITGRYHLRFTMKTRDGLNAYVVPAFLKY